MKKFSKSIAAMVMAATMLSLTAISAGAVDYAEDPDYETIEAVTPDAGTDAENATSNVTEDVVTNAIEAAIANDAEVEIYVTADEAEIAEAAIAEIVKNDMPVTLIADGYAVKIDPATISENTAIDVSMNITVVEGEDSVSGVAVSDKAVVIAPAQKGEFGMVLEVIVPAESVEGLDVDNLLLYYISDDGDVTEMTDALTVNDDGSVSIAISHASEYVITDEEIATAGDTGADTPADTDTSNPVTSVVLFGTAALAAISAAAVAATAKKRK